MAREWSELTDKDVGIIERVYYTVRTGHDYGVWPEFPGTAEGHTDAVAEAKSQIRHFKYAAETPDTFSRVWVEKRYTIRWIPDRECGAAEAAGIDTAVESNEIHLTDAEKQQRIEEARAAA